MPKKRREEDWPIYKLFGAKVQYLRTMLGWTQADLALKTGFNRASIVLIEQGKQRVMLHEVERMAKIFGCSPRQFLKGIWL